MSKVTAYTELTAPSSDDILYIVDSAAGTPTGKKVKVENLVKGGLGVPSSGAILAYSTAATSGVTWSKPTSGATLIGSSLGTPTWLAAGTSGQVLTIADAVPAWAAAAGGLPVAPASAAILVYSTAAATGAWSMPTSASVLTGSSIGAVAWTAAGTSGQVLTIVDTHPAWAAAAGGGSSTINLPAAAWQPTGNPSSFASAQLGVYQSTASVPSPRYNEWLFDATTREYIVTTFRVPPNYTGASAPTLTLQYYSTAAVASGTAWGCMVGGLPTSGDFAAWAFGATAALSTNTVPASAFDLGVATITLTEGSSLMVAGNFVCLALFRDAAVAGDAANGDMHVVSAELAYS